MARSARRLPDQRGTRRQSPRVSPDLDFVRVSSNFRSLPPPDYRHYLRQNINGRPDYPPTSRTAFAAPRHIDGGGGGGGHLPMYGNYFQEPIGFSNGVRDNPDYLRQIDEVLLAYVNGGLNNASTNQIAVATPRSGANLQTYGQLFPELIGFSSGVLGEETLMFDAVEPPHLQMHNQYGLYFQEQQRNGFSRLGLDRVRNHEEVMMLDEIATVAEHHRDVGLRKDVILRHLKRREYCKVDEGENENICAVCQDDLCQENSVVGMLRCRHEFHADCIVQWLQRKNTCPLCNAVALAVEVEQTS